MNDTIDEIRGRYGSNKDEAFIKYVFDKQNEKMVDHIKALKLLNALLKK